MLVHELSDREKTILRYIVQQFILTAAPVGSRYITKKYDVGYSPATIRNIMADLEETGFINHPHTSSGRVPTDKGYRLYVDSLMEIEKLNSNQINLIKDSLTNSESDMTRIFEMTSRLLNHITRQLAYVSYPSIEKASLEKIKLVIISPTRILVVISIKAGIIKTITLELDSELDVKSLEETETLINEKLSGLSFKEIRATFHDRFVDIEEEHKPIIRLFIDSIDKLFKEPISKDNIFITGAKDLAKQPEFDEPERFESIIELIEEKEVIVHIIEKTNQVSKNNVFISIGNENQNEKLSDYSYITKEYKMGESTGTLGIIGPKRMEYSKIIAIVDYVSQLISEILKNEL